MPVRTGGLWLAICAFENLHRAHCLARRGKRDRPDVARFEYDLERNLAELAAELATGTYRPGPYRTFVIREPKPRLISVAPYRDRVMHHALMNVLEPVFDRRMIHDSYACRQGRGTHKALDRYTHFARRYAHVWHGDIRQFFPSIDHAVLYDLLARFIKDRRVLALCGGIIDAGNAQARVVAWFPGDDLFAPLKRRRGLPIGNLTSQWFANLYLDPLDHFVKRELKTEGYLRYCDDFCLFADDAGQLERWQVEVREFLGSLRLKLNPAHLCVRPVAVGERFLGFRVWPDHRRLDPVRLRRTVRYLKGVADDVRTGRSDRAELDRRALAWIVHAAHGDTWRLRGRVLNRLYRRAAGASNMKIGLSDRTA